MTDNFDTLLHDRLARLAEEVPTTPRSSIGVVAPAPVRSGSAARRSFGGYIPLLVLVVVGTVLASVAQLGPRSFAPGSTSENGPVVATTVDGDYELAIRSEKARYAPGEPIDLNASLTYRGGDASVDIWHGYGSPVGFGVVEPVDGRPLSPGWRLSCVPTTLDRGVSLTKPFGKTGGFSNDDPLASAYESYFRDSRLSLPVGTWHVYVLASFSVGECGKDQHEIRAEIEIVVADEAPPAASFSQLPLLTVAGPHGNVCLLARASGTLARHPESGVGLAVGSGPVTPIRWPFGWTAVDGPAGLVLFDQNGAVVGREGDRYSTGGGEGPDGIFAVCSPFPGRTDEPTGPILSPPADGIQPDGSVLGLATDGTLEIRLMAAQAVYVEGEPIDVRATLRYIGTDLTADYSGGIRFHGTQIDGPRSFRFLGVTALMCVRGGFVGDLPIEQALAEVMPRARSLPAGDWRITASFDGSVPSCLSGGQQRDLLASIDIKVVPGTTPSQPIPLLTGDSSGATSSKEFCRLAMAAGTLVPHVRSGLGLAHADGAVQPIRWPSGFTSELLSDGAILYNERGQILAREGDPMQMPGGIGPDGVFTVCGTYLFP